MVSSGLRVLRSINTNGGMYVPLAYVHPYTEICDLDSPQTKQTAFEPVLAMTFSLLGFKVGIPSLVTVVYVVFLKGILNIAVRSKTSVCC